MNNQYVRSGILTIENQILKIGNRTINISKVDNMETCPVEKYPLTSGIVTWAKAWVVVFIVCAILRNSITDIIFTIYTLSIFGLLYYNYKEHQKQLYALIITTGRSTLKIGSDNKQFLDDLLNALESAMNSKKVNFSINLDSCIINNGNNNVNKVEKK